MGARAVHRRGWHAEKCHVLCAFYMLRILSTLTENRIKKIENENANARILVIVVTR